jgi:hypothetical protein
MNIAVPSLYVSSNAIFSECSKYRYTLSRIWDEDEPICVFIGLNPSTADIQYNDPTLNRCMRSAMDWGFGSLIMLNIFAYRSTDPKGLYTQEDPIGKYNNKYLIEIVSKADIIIAAWGTHGEYLNRGNNVIEMLSSIKKLHCLDINKNGTPKHPLYISKNNKPFIYRDKC